MVKPNNIALFPERVNVNRKIQKQISLFVSREEFLVIRRESATRKISMTALINEWIQPALKKLGAKVK